MGYCLIPTTKGQQMLFLVGKGGEGKSRVQIKGIQRMLEDNGVNLHLSDMAIDYLATAGYDPEFGARPVKRAIQRYLLNDLSKKLLSLQVDRSKPIIVERGNDGLIFRN